MRKIRYGFTLIEVAIFLAVTGALFAAVTIGVQNSIYQQRYNDTVQSFVDFLGNLYSEVVSVQSAGTGRSGEAIYGKLVTFGENNNEDNAAGKQVIHTYDVVAKAVNSWDNGVKNMSTIDLLQINTDNLKMDANVVRKNESTNAYEPIGVVSDYTPKWGARIEQVGSYADYKGALLIVRNVLTGTVQTYVYNKTNGQDTIEVKQALENLVDEELNVFKYADGDGWGNYLRGFREQTVDFCLNPNPSEQSNTRMDVRIIKGAHDASGVETISFDNEGYECRVTEEP